MKVLDATFLIDYLDGVEATRQFYEDNGGDQIRWTVPVPALAAVLVGEGNLPNGDAMVLARIYCGPPFTPSTSERPLRRDRSRTRSRRVVPTWMDLTR